MSDIKLLVNELCAVRDKWFELGVQLNLLPSDLNVIQMECNNKPSRCLLGMLSLWLKVTSPPPTWQNVVDALCSPAVSRPVVAKAIIKEYCSQDIGM